MITSQVFSDFVKSPNRVGQKVQTIVRVSRENGRTLSCTFFFFNGFEFVSSSEVLGRASMVAPGTVAVSATGRQWVAVGGDRVKGAAGWAFVSPYVDQPSVGVDVVRFNSSSKALKLRSKLDEYLDYYYFCKGFLPASVVLRGDQLRVVGALPGQIYKGVSLEVYS